MGKKQKLVYELKDSNLIEIVKSKKCSIKECDDYATENMCRIGMCKKHYREAKD